MVAPRARLIPDQATLDIWRDLDAALGREVRLEYQRLATNLRRRILRPLMVEPGFPSHPLKWKSRKQQQAYFASDGFGGGIPGHRTLDFMNSYDVHVDTRGFEGFVYVENSSPYAPYLIPIGDDYDVQPFHEDTWAKQFRKTVEEVQPPIMDILTEGYYTAFLKALNRRGAA